MQVQAGLFQMKQHPHCWMSCSMHSRGEALPRCNLGLTQTSKFKYVST